jgi:hypothetical protein
MEHTCPSDANECHEPAGEAWITRESDVLPACTDSRCTLSITENAVAEPFVVQHQGSIFFITWEPTRWVLAELAFDPVSCTFVEQRRTHYEWPREAFGVLMSRFATIDRVDFDRLNRTSDDFGRWLGQQFSVMS